MPSAPSVKLSLIIPPSRGPVSVLRDLDVLEDAKLAHKAVPLGKLLVPEHLLLFPVRLVELLGAGYDARRAGRAFAHAAAVFQVRIGVFPDAGQHDEVAVGGDVAFVGSVLAVDDDFRHGTTLAEYGPTLGPPAGKAPGEWCQAARTAAASSSAMSPLT